MPIQVISSALPVLELVYAYILEYSGMDEKTIFQGYRNNFTLPKKHNNFCVVTLLHHAPHGTNEHSYTDDSETVTTMYKTGVQVQAFGDNLLKAQETILKIQALFRDEIATEFFKETPITPLYADEVKSVPVVDASNQYVPKFKLDLYFSSKVETIIPVQTFSAVTPNIANVDVKFPVN